jgi:hypothetical protein
VDATTIDLSVEGSRGLSCASAGAASANVATQAMSTRRDGIVSLP